MLTLSLVAMLGGCAGVNQLGERIDGLGGSTAQAPAVGPQHSSEFGQSEAEAAVAHLPKIDVIVPVFDPNLPEDSDTWEKKGIYPELRRAESNRFALKMKAALEDTNVFGSVRVTPSASATGELYVLGKILQSNGEDVRINIAVADISARKWLDRDFSHRVKESFQTDLRNKGKDPYEPVFADAAAHVVEQLSRRDAAALDDLRLLGELRFGASLSEETFARYLRTRNGRVSAVAAPAADDPMRTRIQPIRVRDQLFMDEMQTHYTDFNQRLDSSYLIWQQQSLLEVKAAREAKRKSIAKGILGGLLVVAGVAVGAQADNNVGEEIASVGATVAGALVLGSSFQDRAEMKMHREALAELGKSIDIEVAPQVVEYENKTAELSGDAAEQYAQWIEFLKRIYELEATPDKEL
ncbi:MAG: hypothetical protein ACR2P7_05555 [bacterium]